MEQELIDLDLLPKRIRNNAFTCQTPQPLYDCLFARQPGRAWGGSAQVRNSANCRLVQKIEQVRDSQPEKYHHYFNKIIRNVRNGQLDLH